MKSKTPKIETITLGEDTYYIDTAPAHYIHNHNLSRFKDNIKIFFKKNVIENPVEISKHIKSWFTGRTQPTEQQILEGFIYQMGDIHGYEYKLKVGGGADADRLFESSFTWTQCDKNYNDKDLILVKKYSMDFKNILIYPHEISKLLENITTEKQCHSHMSEDVSLSYKAWARAVRINKPEEAEFWLKHIAETYEPSHIKQWEKSVRNSITTSLGYLEKVDDFLKAFDTFKKNNA